MGILKTLLLEEYSYCRVAKIVLDLWFLTTLFSLSIITVVRQSGNEEILSQHCKVSGKQILHYWCQYCCFCQKDSMGSFLSLTITVDFKSQQKE